MSWEFKILLINIYFIKIIKLVLYLLKMIKANLRPNTLIFSIIILEN